MINLDNLLLLIVLIVGDASTSIGNRVTAIDEKIKGLCDCRHTMTFETELNYHLTLQTYSNLNETLPGLDAELMKFKEQLKKVKGPTADNIKRRFVKPFLTLSIIHINVTESS